jgi:hypothetical protein
MSDDYYVDPARTTRQPLIGALTMLVHRVVTRT